MSTLNDDSELREKLRRFQYNDRQAIELSDDHIGYILQVVHQRDEVRDKAFLNRLLELHHSSETGAAKRETSQDGYEYGLEDAIALLVSDVHETLYQYNQELINRGEDQ